MGEKLIEKTAYNEIFLHYKRKIIEGFDLEKCVYYRSLGIRMDLHPENLCNITVLYT
jgi:hypothetical protein